MAYIVKCSLDVRIQYPCIGSISESIVTLFYGIMAPSTWTETIAVSLETGFPFWFQSILDNCLDNTVFNDGYAQGAFLSVGFWYLNPSGGFCFPRLMFH